MLTSKLNTVKQAVRCEQHSDGLLLRAFAELLSVAMVGRALYQRDIWLLWRKQIEAIFLFVCMYVITSVRRTVFCK